MGGCARWARHHATALALAAATGALVWLLYVTDRRLGLHESANTRYRFHAIPVAVSVLYHHRPHDYTAHRGLAMRFHDSGRNLDEQIRGTVDPAFPVGDGTYYWVADDRGLADFVCGAFHLFGPRVSSLSNLWFLILSISLLLYTIAFWRVPAALIVPPLFLLGWLGIASIAPESLPFPNAMGYWGEAIALYESRMFDGLALVAVLHLAILAGSGGRVSRLAWLAAVPQVAILLFLYHARSSLGWQYAALFCLAGLRIGLWVLNRRFDCPPPTEVFARPLFVVALLAVSLGGLKQYQRAVYHPDYSREYGQRTFWHNALMGLAFNPTLRDGLPMAHCDDRNAVDLVLSRMEEREPGLDRNVWNWQAALNSLGNHNQFDWNRYERVAREVYFEAWRSRSLQMAECYAYDKPRDLIRQARIAGGRLATGLVRGTMPEFAIGCGVVIGALVIVVSVAKREPDVGSWLRSLSRIAAVLVPFSLIPGIAFYPALPTIAGFYLLSVTLCGLLALRLAASVRLQSC
jgi:hypothetical protein